MTRLDRIFEIAGLDLESVRHSAGRINCVLILPTRKVGGEWYNPIDSFQPPSAVPWGFIDIWAISDPSFKRHEFKLFTIGGELVVDSASVPATNGKDKFFAYPVLLTDAQYKELLLLPEQIIVNR